MSARGTRWKAGAQVPAGWIFVGYEARKAAGLPRINLWLEADKFVDYWSARAGAGATKVDWLATWRNWCRSAEGAPESEQSVPSDDADARTLALAIKGIKTQNFGPDLVKRGLARGLLTKEQARMLGF